MPRQIPSPSCRPDETPCRPAAPALGPALLLACPWLAGAALAAVGAPAAPPVAELKLATALAATRSPAAVSFLADDPAPILRSDSVLRSHGARRYAAASQALPTDVDGDVVGGDAPTGPPVRLADLPGRQPPPLPSLLAPSPPAPNQPLPGEPLGTSAPLLMPGIPGLPGVPCLPSVLCVPVRQPVDTDLDPDFDASSLPPYVPPAPADGRQGGSTTSSNDETDGSAATPGLSALGWGIAPVRWGGSFGLQTSRQRQADGAGSSALQGLFNLRASSYIYQPWLAQISGNLGITSGRSTATSASTDSGSATADQRTAQSSLTGGGVLSLFPMSRFPFVATFDRSDSQSSGAFVSSAYTNTRLGLRQSYRTDSGAQNATVGYDRSVVESTNGSENTVNALYGNYSHAFTNQTTQMNGRISQSESGASGESSRLINYYARHTYRFDENLNVETSTTLNDNLLNYRSGNTLSASRGRYVQLNSSASWRPESEYEDEISPLSVTGGFNMYTATTDFNGQASQSRTMSANVAANYAYSQNLTLLGSGLVTRVANADGQAQMLTNVGGAASYAGTPLTFGNFSYNWNVGGSMNRQGGGTLGANRLWTTQGSHSLSRDYPLSETQAVNLSLTQNLSHSNDQRIGAATTLNHSAGATWRVFGAAQSYGSVGLSFSDNVTSGTNEGHYRFINLQINGNGQLSAQSSISANLSLQWSMQETT
ncbi:MAG TPA: hypothetical protein VFY24_13460, partial [Azospira sp.]|nr:hypothetical protein [Azospira sp.]